MIKTQEGRVREEQEAREYYYKWKQGQRLMSSGFRSLETQKFGGSDEEAIQVTESRFDDI